MIHLLDRYSRRCGDRRVLTERELTGAGLHCDVDRRLALVNTGIVTGHGDEYQLSAPVAEILRRFTVAKSPAAGVDIRLDYPEVEASVRSRPSGMAAIP